MEIVYRLSRHLKGTGDRSKKVLTGSVFMLISTLVSNITRVGLISILARVYTRDQFGVWVTITSVTAIMATNDFGVGNALRNKLSELRARNDENADKEAREYFLSVFYFFMFFAFLISLLLIFFQNNIPYERIFKTENIGLKEEVKNILLIVQVIFLISIPLGIGGTMFFAYLETFWVALFNIVNGVATVVVIGIMAYLGKSITLSAIVFFGISLLISAVSTGYFLYKRKWNLFGISWRLIFSRVWKLLAQSFMFAILQISGTFMYNAMTIVVTANIGLRDAAEFNLVQKIYTFIMAIYLSLYNPLWAGYSDAAFRNDWSWVKRTLIKTILGTVLLFCLAVLVFAFSGNFFLMLLAGKNYTSQMILFTLMGLWALFYSLYLLGIAFLSATGRINLITILTAFFAFIFVSVATYFGKIGSIEGVAVWAVISFLVLAFATYWQGFSIVKMRSSQLSRQQMNR